MRFSAERIERYGEDAEGAVAPRRERPDFAVSPFGEIDGDRPPEASIPGFGERYASLTLLEVDATAEEDANSVATWKSRSDSQIPT